MGNVSETVARQGVELPLEDTSFPGSRSPLRAAQTTRIVCIPARQTLFGGTAFCSRSKFLNPRKSPRCDAKMRHSTSMAPSLHSGVISRRSDFWPTRRLPRLPGSRCAAAFLFHHHLESSAHEAH